MDVTATERLAPRHRDGVADFLERMRSRLPGLSTTVTLFGSWARGTAEADSDVDLLVEVSEEQLDEARRRAIARLASEASLAHGVVLSLVVMDGEQVRERAGYSLLQAIRDEGMPV